MSWFVPKSHGWGAAPKDWRGWALILGFIAVDLLALWFLILRSVVAGAMPAAWQMIVFAILFGLLPVILIVVVRSLTDGEWRWRWGGREENRR